MYCNNQIIAVRKKLGMSQESFGAKLGVSRSVIKNIEYGLVEPKPLFIEHLCKVYGVNEKWICSGNGNMFVKQDVELSIIDKLTEEYKLGEYAVRFLKEYIRLDANGRKTVDGYLERVAKSPDDAPEQTVVMRFAHSPDGSIPPTIEKMDAEKVNRLFNLPETDENI